MLYQNAKWICLATGIACLVGCSNNGILPMSVNENNKQLTAAVGTNGAMAVAAGGGQVWSISYDVYQNGTHKVYKLNGSSWTLVVTPYYFDSKKIACDPTGAPYVAAADYTLWKYNSSNSYWEQQMELIHYPDGPAIPVLARDVTIESNGTIDIIGNEPGTYGYFIRTSMPSMPGNWWNYMGTDQNYTGVALAADPRSNSSILWFVRNNGELREYACPSLPLRATDAKEVGVGPNGYVYYISNGTPPYPQYPNDYRIMVSTTEGVSFISACAVGVQVDAGWFVNSFGSVFKYNGNSFVPGNHIWDQY